MQNTSLKKLFYDIDHYISGQKTIKLLKENIGNRLLDLIYYLPYKQINADLCEKWDDLQENKRVLIKVIIKKHYYSYKFKKIPYKISATFDNRTINLIFFSKYTAYLKQIYKEQSEVFIVGTLGVYNKKYQILHPEIVNYKKTEGKKGIFIKLFYRQRGGLKSNLIHKSILKCLNDLPNLEEWNIALFKRYLNIPTWDSAIKNIHLGYNDKILERDSTSIKRLAYDEIFATQLSLEIIRLSINNERSNNYVEESERTIKSFENNLPFKLTKNQKYNINEIIDDLNSQKKMLRILHGDVGSGKTIVAIISALHVICSGYQVAILVPTELLANQHYDFIQERFKLLNINVCLLTSSTEYKSALHKKIENGNYNLVIGTHTLIQNNIRFKNLSYVIIDEQHRFGVEQRLKIRKKGSKVDMLLLSATPIPRTMLLVTLGDISISTIKEKPFTNKVTTILKSDKNLSEVIKYIKKKINIEHKVFWICPMIEESDSNSYESSLKNRYELLKSNFKSIGFLHGKLDSKKKKDVLEKFKNGTIKVLISTVVIEVGIDIPDANIILIDNADRFGLAQIHQLRGRVGRGNSDGLCILLYKEPLSDIAIKRLKILKESNNGFDLAEKDMIIRGGGEILGKKQYGFESFIFFDIVKHNDLLILSIAEAKEILKEDPKLISNRGKLLIDLLYLFEKDKAINLISAG